jgi:hypothetical protein
MNPKYKLACEISVGFKRKEKFKDALFAGRTVFCVNRQSNADSLHLVT